MLKPTYFIAISAITILSFSSCLTRDLNKSNKNAKYTSSKTKILDTSFFDGDFQKPPSRVFQEKSLSDVGENLPALKSSFAPILTSASSEERFEYLAKYKIEHVTAAPGHRVLRKPNQVLGLVDYLQNSNGGEFSQDKFILNIVTKENIPVSIDLWNAHHRFVAYLQLNKELETGKRVGKEFETIGDIPKDNLEILVNGVRANQETWVHYLSISGIDPETKPDYRVIPPGGDIRVGTVGVSGEFTNFYLGSRNSIGQLYKNTFERKAPKIAVYFGTFDPPHEGHRSVAQTALSSQKFDDVVFIPNWTSIEKPNATAGKIRVEMLSAMLKENENLNVYTEDTRGITDSFGRGPLYELLAQAYGTKNITQIMGADSFVKLFEQGKIIESDGIQYLVLNRAGSIIPEAAKNAPFSSFVSFANNPDEADLSSTKIRNAVKTGEKLPESTLPKEVLKVVEKHGLYK